MALNPQNEPVYQMEICNEWITMIRDNGSIELYHIPTIKGTVSPYEGEPLTGAQTAAMAPPSPPKPTLSISKNISTGRLNTKPLSTQNKIDRKELKNVLNGFGEFPARYRLLIWRHLLQIPENESSFKALWERGRHSSVANLDKTYPLKSQRLFRALERTISCVAHWNSLFGELDYIPIMVFPFVKLFQHSPIHCFEVISTGKCYKANHVGTILEDSCESLKIMPTCDPVSRFMIPKSEDRLCNMNKSYSIGHVTGSVFIRIHQYQF